MNRPKETPGDMDSRQLALTAVNLRKRVYNLPAGWVARRPAGGTRPAWRAWRAWRACALLSAVILLGTAGCNRAEAAAHSPLPCRGIAPGFSCVMQHRIRSVERYLATQPGEIGIVLHDRRTGATWRNREAGTPMPAASTVKLAIAADLLLRQRAGSLSLTDADRDLLHAALHESSDAAADQLWSAFESGSFAQRIKRFGMNDTSFCSSPPYWGCVYTTADDLDSLMNHVLGKLPARDRIYLVYQLRHVAWDQQWGVWGAGRSSHPGNKDGWEDNDGVWITDTVGFAGPRERYTLSIMDDLEGTADFPTGINTLSQVAALLFRDRHVPAPAVQATP